MTAISAAVGDTPTEEDDAGSDARLESFVLDAASLSSASDPDLVSKVEDAHVDLSMSAGAPMLEVTVLDPERDLLMSGYLEQRVDVTLDRIPFRLVEFDFDGIDALTLSFEHRIVAWARAHGSPRKFSRGSFTRAEAIYSMFREIKAGPVRFVSPDLHKRQKIKSSIERPSKREKDANRESGFADDVKLYGRSKTTPLTKGQVANAERVLDACASHNAPPKATLATVEACIIEGPDFNNPTGGDASSVGILQLLNIHLGGSTSTNGGRRDIEKVVGLFLTEGFWGKGGALELARKNPGWTAGQVAQQTQGSAFPKRYDEVREQAKDIIAQYTGGGESFGGGGTARQGYEFTRGLAGKKEDTWVAGQRLAGEVRWRLFIAGAQTVYYASDEVLIASRPRYLIDPTTVGLVGHPRGKVEVGGRSILIRGKRQPKPSECEITVRLDRWAAPPGTVIEVAGYGAYDGRWIVEKIDRPPFDSQAVIGLRAPQKPLSEPAAEIRTPSQTTVKGKSSSDRVYAEAQRISALKLPYGPGGHGLSWAAAKQGIKGASPGASLDCSSSTSLALYAGDLVPAINGPAVSDYFKSWGDPGKGKHMTVWVKPGSGANGHVWIEFYGKPMKRFDTSPYGSGPRGPQLRSTERPTTGFHARHWPGT
jgi:hypothetical protein